jgi:hypothetical protein
MKTTIKGIEIKKAIELVKPFVGSLRKKYDSRPILKTALINENYVIATDASILIRVKHNETVETPYLYDFKKSDSPKEVSSYPNISSLLPDKYNAQQEVKINVAEWIEAHTLGLVAAKEHKHKVIKIENNKIYTNFSGETPKFNDIAFTYTLDNDTKIEKVAYNCEYMLMALKTFKKLKEKEVTMYYYGPMRPMYFVSDTCEILVLPVRTY